MTENTQKSAAGVQTPQWIVVANEAAAEFCMQPRKNGRIDRLFTLHNDVARKKTAEIISSRGGRSFDSHGYGRHTHSRQHEPKDVYLLKFARTIAKRLLEVEHNEPVAGIVLVAPPRFIGLLRKAIAVAGGIEPCRTINKDVVGIDERHLQQLLAEVT